MIRKDKYGSFAASGLRTRYFPKSRIGHGLISVAPWLNIMLLLVFFLMIDRKFVLEPGVLVDLPKASLEQGSPFGMTAVVLPVRGTGTNGTEEIVFFDDVRYRLDNDMQKKRLQRAFNQKAGVGQDSTLIIQADKNVLHGTVVDLMNMALVAGIGRVNIAARP